MTKTAVEAVSATDDLFPLLEQGFHLSASKDGQELLCRRSTAKNEHELRIRLDDDGQWVASGKETARSTGASHTLEAKGTRLHEAATAAQRNFLDQDFEKPSLVGKAVEGTKALFSSAWDGLKTKLGVVKGWARAAEMAYLQTGANILLKQGWEQEKESDDPKKHFLVRKLEDGTVQRLTLEEREKEPAPPQGKELRPERATAPPKYMATLESVSKQGHVQARESLMENGWLGIMSQCAKQANEQAAVVERKEARMQEMVGRVAARARNPAGVHLAAIATDEAGRAIVEVREVGQAAPLTHIRVKMGPAVEEFAAAVGAHFGMKPPRIVDERQERGPQTFAESAKHFADSATLTGLGRKAVDMVKGVGLEPSQKAALAATGSMPGIPSAERRRPAADRGR